jgi:hypothetical protein
MTVGKIGAVDQSKRSRARSGTIGGGARSFLGVELKDGKVYGLDAERDRSPIFLLNSDIDRFVKTFRLFDETIRYRRIRIPDLPSLAAAIDPDAYAASEWRLLADYLLPD